MLFSVLVSKTYTILHIVNTECVDYFLLCTLIKILGRTLMVEIDRKYKLQINIFSLGFTRNFLHDRNVEIFLVYGTVEMPK